MRSIALVIALAALCAAPANSQPAADNDNSSLLAKQIAPAKQGARLTVRSSAFIGGGDIPDKYAKDNENMSPPMEWSKGPQGTRSYAIIAEDAGAKVHWLVYDIDGSQTRLGTDVPKDAKPGGAIQAKNADGAIGYTGPDPDSGKSGTYHFQVFALNSKLNIDPAKADRDTVISAIKGRVLASGDLIGRYTGK